MFNRLSFKELCNKLALAYEEGLYTEANLILAEMKARLSMSEWG